ncbi:hypothetical protein [Nocardia miyunensis]|uniref:hypothetical protein n=1 Tax=Nocardia miyunensis TaxID=282684 RepID=UPI0008318F1D|nr:hypothetical protein [Nocardia miyunensis]
MSTYTGRHRATVSIYRRALFAVTLHLREWLTLIAPTIRYLFEPASGILASIVLLSLLPTPAAELLHAFAVGGAALILALSAILTLDTAIR